MEPWLIEALKAYPCVALEGGMLRSCPVRLSFAQHLFEAQPGQLQDDGTMGKPKFSVTLLFPKGADISILEAAVKVTETGKFGTAYKGPKLHSPFRDQGEKGHLAGYEEGAVFVSSSSQTKPGVVVAVPGGKPRAATPDDVYSGCWALVTLNPYAFTNSKKKGVSLGLGNVMKIRDGDRFTSRSTAEADFGEVAITNDFDVDALMS